MGNGTKIAWGYSIVNFAFTILEDGQSQSALGNHVSTILKIEENWEIIGWSTRLQGTQRYRGDFYKRKSL